jgi:hypothetical protein
LASPISEAEMTDTRSIVLTVAVIALVLAGLYLIDPTFFGMMKYEGFENTMSSNANYKQPAGMNETSGGSQENATVTNPNIAGFQNGAVDCEMNPDHPECKKAAEGFGDYEDVSGPASFGSAESPAGCYPRDQLTPGELLPKDMNSVWAQQNPMGTGSLKGKNFLSAGALIGVNTVGQSLRNANLQLRSEPPNPQVPVSVFNNSTIEPDVNRRDFEVN